MHISKLLFISLTTLTTTSVFAEGISIGKNGIQVGDISIDSGGVEVASPNGVKVKNSSDSHEATNSLHCSKKHPNANVSGVNRTITITGKCNNIIVNGTNIQLTAKKARTLTERGSNNEIKIHQVNLIKVAGTNSEVNYNSNFHGKSAKVSITGINADVERN